MIVAASGARATPFSLPHIRLVPWKRIFLLPVHISLPASHFLYNKLLLVLFKIEIGYGGVEQSKWLCLWVDCGGLSLVLSLQPGDPKLLMKVSDSTVDAFHPLPCYLPSTNSPTAFDYFTFWHVLFSKYEYFVSISTFCCFQDERRLTAFTQVLLGFCFLFYDNFIVVSFFSVSWFSFSWQSEFSVHFWVFWFLGGLFSRS